MDCKMSTFFKLFAAVFIISWSSILVRWMGNIDPLIISFYRLFFSALGLSLYLKFKPGQRSNIIKTNWALIGLAGFFLALHFVSWITSLQKTTVGRSIFLESTHPIFAILLSLWFLKEKAPRIFYAFALISLIGIYFTIHRDISGWDKGLSGDMLALFSAFCLAAYLLIARKIGHNIPILRYLLYVYGAAALFIIPFLIFKRLEFWNLSASIWFFLILLTLGPNLIGHSMLNWASRRIEIYKVNMVLLSESVFATFLAALFLKEYPTFEFYLGAAMILAGIGGMVRTTQSGKRM